MSEPVSGCRQMPWISCLSSAEAGTEAENAASATAAGNVESRIKSPRFFMRQSLWSRYAQIYAFYFVLGLAKQRHVMAASKLRLPARRFLFTSSWIRFRNPLNSFSSQHHGITQKFEPALQLKAGSQPGGGGLCSLPGGGGPAADRNSHRFIARPARPSTNDKIAAP